MKGGISLVEPRELTEEEKQQLADLSPEFKERTEKKFKKLTITNLIYIRKTGVYINSSIEIQQIQHCF